MVESARAGCSVCSRGDLDDPKALQEVALRSECQCYTYLDQH